MSDFKPTTARELEAVVAQAVAREAPLELVAGGTKRGLGRPLQLPHRLDLSAFAGISLYEPEELVLTAGAATPLAAIEAALDEKRQMLAFEPADWRVLLGTADAAPTIGGTLACNLAGPRRIRQGAARDHFLGFSAVSGRGETFKAGGRVVKNVTGYDLPKLIAGSYGTLAALMEVTLKVLPRPEATRTLALKSLDDEAARRALSAALASPHEISGAAHLPDAVSPQGARTLLRLEGPGPSVEARVRGLCEDLAGHGAIEVLGDEDSHALWRAVRDVELFASLADRAVWRVSVAPTEGPNVVARVARGLDLRHFYDWGGGLVWLAVRGAEDGGASVIRAAFGSGHATLIRGSHALRLAVPVFQPQPQALAALAARVKDGFDPRHILNRGRMVREA